MGKAANEASLRYLIHDGEYPVDAFLRRVFFFGQRHRLSLGGKERDTHGVSDKNNGSDRALQCSSEKQQR